MKRRALLIVHGDTVAPRHSEVLHAASRRANSDSPDI